MQQKSGSYLYHIEEINNDSLHTLATVKEQQTKYLNLDNSRAKLARSIQERLCLPSNVGLGNAIDLRWLLECRNSKRSVCIATNIY